MGLFPPQLLQTLMNRYPAFRSRWNAMGQRGMLPADPNALTAMGQRGLLPAQQQPPFSADPDTISAMGRRGLLPGGLLSTNDNAVVVPAAQQAPAPVRPRAKPLPKPVKAKKIKLTPHMRREMMIPGFGPGG